MMSPSEQHSTVTWSLILATRHRTREVASFFKSLQTTTLPIEVIVADQNEDDRLSPILAAAPSHVRVRWLKTRPGISLSRNAALDHACGTYIAFPDDDCEYPSGMLERVTAYLDQHSEAAGLTGRAVTRGGEPSTGKFDLTPGYVDHHNVWRRGISFTIFLRRDVVVGQRFDTSLGLGAKWGAGEETELLLRLMQGGASFFFDPTLTVYHPRSEMRATKETARRARAYGRGIGRVLRLHQKHFPISVLAAAGLRPLGGAACSLLQLDVARAEFHLAALLGRIEGWRGSDIPIGKNKS